MQEVYEAEDIKNPLLSPEPDEEKLVLSFWFDKIVKKSEVDLYYS